MAQSPDEPTTAGGSEPDALPWRPSPAALALEHPEGANSAEEAVGGGSHRPADEPAATAAWRAAEPGSPPAERLADAAMIADALADTIAAQPLKAVGIAATLGFLAALLFRR